MFKNETVRAMVLLLLLTALAFAAQKKEPGVSTKTHAATRSVGSESVAERQAKAYRAYQDYQYVKTMGPISGPLYRSTKW